MNIGSKYIHRKMPSITLELIFSIYTTSEGNSYVQIDQVVQPIILEACASMVEILREKHSFIEPTMENKLY